MIEIDRVERRLAHDRTFARRELADDALVNWARTLRDGGTVLLHDSDCTSRPGSWRSTVASLPLLAAQVEGLEVRTLVDHLGASC